MRLPYRTVICEGLGVISIAEYSTRGFDPSFPEYLAQNSYVSGMIEWEPDEAFRWAGEFDGGFVFAMIKDYRGKPLQSCLQIDVAHYNNLRTHLYLWPSGTARKYFPEITSKYPNHEYIECELNGIQCSSTNYTEDQLRELITRATIEEIAFYQRNLQRRRGEYRCNSSEQASLEFPFKIYLCGTDDFSMTKYFSNLEECEMVLADISANPNFETLEKYCFHFSN